jgi:hypothetical protein
MEHCPECGAPVPEGGTCQQNFHALLLLEGEVPGAPGGLPHFYAVASYGLQHPDSMSYTAEALAWLRSAVARALSGEVDVADLRRSARHQGGSARVQRRDGDEVPGWGISSWSMTVTDVLAGGADVYAERVRDWGASIVADLERVGR